ncbi:MAG: fasciclin domain-containing protein [Chloroflexota bacterium]
MNQTVKFLTLFVALFAMAALWASPTQASNHQVEANIMDIVAADARFNTLEAAVKAAGLADTLASANNSFTVFAPTDAAFAALPAGLVAELLQDPGGDLTQILLYHVVPGSLNSGAVLGSSSLATAQGGTLNVNLRDGNPYVNDSMITITDIPAKNGIIHVIDAVLVPEISLPSPDAAPADPASLPSIAEIAASDGRFDTLVAAADAAGLVPILAGPGNFTVFAPTDDAFAALGQDTINALLADPSGELTNILLYHVVGDQLRAEQIATDKYIPTLDGRALRVGYDSNRRLVLNENTYFLIANIQASNGVIHVIDRVLIP